MDPSYMRKRLLLAKIETTEGVDPTPTVGSNAISVNEATPTWQSDLIENNALRDSISSKAPRISRPNMNISFQTYLKGSGTAGSVPEIGALFRACGMAESIDAGSSVIYTPSSDALDSITLYLYEIFGTGAGSTVLHKVHGARGNFSITAPAGAPAMVDWTFQGTIPDPTDVNHPGTATFQSTVEPIVETSSFALNSNSDLILQQLTFDMGNNLVQREDVNSDDGLKGYIITERNAAGSMNPEAVLLATYDWYADWKAGTGRALTMNVGSVAGNKCQITAPNVMVENINQGDRNSLNVKDIALRFNLENGDDEVQLAFDW